MKNSLITSLVLLFLALLLTIWNPFAFTGVAQALYFLILFVWLLYDHLTDHNKIGTLSNDEKQYINGEKIKSIIRAVIQALGILVALIGVFNLNFPYLGFINDFLNFISDKVDITVQAINVLIGIGIALYGYFKDPTRWQSRALIHPKKVNI